MIEPVLIIRAESETRLTCYVSFLSHWKRYCTSFAFSRSYKETNDTVARKSDRFYSDLSATRRRNYRFAGLTFEQVWACLQTALHQTTLGRRWQPKPILQRVLTDDAILSDDLGVIQINAGAYRAGFWSRAVKLAGWMRRQVLAVFG